jgi:lactate permease
VILAVTAFVWGLPPVKVALNHLSDPKFAIEGLHNLIQRMPPVVPAHSKPEPAVFDFLWLSASGSGILVAALIAAGVMRIGFAGVWQTYGMTLYAVRYSLLTIAAMLALGYVTRYSGLDATMGLAFARTGVFYPFFGTLLGWLGVALTGSDTSSNILFGSLQRITAQQLHLKPLLMVAANSSGGVMGKMIDAQSIVVASTATNWFGHEGEILRYVFFHSLALGCLVGIFVTLQAYVPPFSHMVP